MDGEPVEAGPSRSPADQGDGDELRAAFQRARDSIPSDDAEAADGESQAAVQEVWETTRAYAAASLPGCSRACLLVAIATAFASALVWGLHAVLAVVGLHVLGTAAPAAITALVTVVGVASSRLLARWAERTAADEPDSGDWPTDAAAVVRRSVASTYAVAVAAFVAAATLTVAVIGAGATRVPHQLLLSRAGVHAALWQFLDGIPLLDLPDVLGLEAPRTVGTPIGFRACLLAARCAAIIGVVAGLHGAFGGRTGARPTS